MKLLVIEDEAKISSFLKKSLEAEYFAVDVAEDGEHGSHLAQINEYDLIILDNVLPKKEGVEVLREIRASGSTTPVIILSVKNETVKKIDLLNAGADDYLTKPFMLGELLARVRALLRRPVRTEQEVVQVGDVILDVKSSRVLRGKKEINLTRKEFMLLQYLMQHEGTVLSRGMILEHVWDMSVDIFSNTIESHMVSLRKKIEAPRQPKLIHTVAGRGYKIVG